MVTRSTRYFRSTCCALLVLMACTKTPLLAQINYAFGDTIVARSFQPETTVYGHAWLGADTILVSANRTIAVDTFVRPDGTSIIRLSSDAELWTAGHRGTQDFHSTRIRTALFYGRFARDPAGNVYFTGGPDGTWETPALVAGVYRVYVTQQGRALGVGGLVVQ